MVERDDALNRGTVRSPLFKPSNAQAAALRERLERLQRPATMLGLLRSALPTGFEPSAVVSCRTLSVHPDRAVLHVRARADSGPEREYTVKCYCDDIGERIWSFTRGLAAGLPDDGDDRVSLPIAYVRDEWALVSAWIDGTPLSEVLDARTPGLLRRAASIVATLHRLAMSPEPPTTPAMLIDETLARRERLRARWPTALPLVDPVLGALREAAAVLDPAAPAPVHGDLGGAQFLWTGSRLVLIDWDGFGYADPAFDAGHFLAQLDRVAIVNPALRAHAAEWIASFIDPYGAAMPRVSHRNVAFYRAMTLLWKIHTICRVQPAAWPQLVPQLARAAHAALQGAGATQSSR